MNRILVDRCHRNINYLRVSITDHCNLQCIYCTGDKPFKKLAHEEILRFEEILRIIRIGTTLGIRKVRITGGEPLARKGVYDFLGGLREIEALEDISLTTNGVMLKNNLHKIKAAGIKRLNISLDTLDPEKYAEITGKHFFENVRQGMDAAARAGFAPIKINTVALRGINDDEFIRLAELSINNPFHIRFIEEMPIGGAEIRHRNPILIPEIKERISPLGKLHPVPHGSLDGPAERFRLDGAMGEIGFISAISHHFCAQCNRLRLTADGRLRPCLLSDEAIDIKTPLRSGASDKELSDIIVKTVSLKKTEHDITPESDKNSVRSKMFTIGG